MYTILIFVMFLFSYYLGKSNAKIQGYSDGRIIGGVDTDITKHPYQVSLESVYSGGFHHCGGSILNNYWVVTAAHCVHRKNSDNFRIRAGTSTKGKGGTLHQISKFIIHPEFKYRAADYDIAVIKVSEPFVYSNNVKPIPLANVEPTSGTPVVVTGWGLLDDESESFPTQLQKVQVNIIRRSECEKQYVHNRNITQRMICAGVPEGGKDSCSGDSGGPLVSQGELVGVVSWGRGCADKYYPGVYSNIAELKNWLDSVINLK